MGKPKAPSESKQASAQRTPPCGVEWPALHGQRSIPAGHRPLHTKQTRPRGPWADGSARRRRLARARDERECALASLLLGEAPTPPPPAPLARAAGHSPRSKRGQWLRSKSGLAMGGGETRPLRAPTPERRAKSPASRAGCPLCRGAVWWRLFDFFSRAWPFGRAARPPLSPLHLSPSSAPHLLPPPDHCWVPRPALQHPLVVVAHESRARKLALLAPPRRPPAPPCPP